MWLRNAPSLNVPSTLSNEMAIVHFSLMIKFWFHRVPIYYAYSAYSAFICEPELNVFLGDRNHQLQKCEKGNFFFYLIRINGVI